MSPPRTKQARIAPSPSPALDHQQARHVQADPLQRAQLEAALGTIQSSMSEFKCAVVLCDHQWLDPDRDDANGLGSVDAPSVLRIDALIMTVQVRGGLVGWLAGLVG